MKLRNKKTGEIVDLCDGSINSNIDGENIIVFSPMHPGKYQELKYASLSELNEEWEDYTPPKPLIKDEKIRKAVKAWAEFHDIHKVTVNKGWYYNTDKEYVCFFSTTAGVSIEITGDLGLKDETYTIAELCGEGKQ